MRNSPTPRAPLAQSGFGAEVRDALASAPPAWLSDRGDGPRWTPLTFTSVESKKTTLSPLDDGSVLATVANDRDEKYVISLPVEAGMLDGLTGVKLEALTHESLPNFGPGIADGNFVLGEIQVMFKPKGGKFETLELAEARADLSQENYDVSTAIDGQPKGRNNNGWAVGNGRSRPHWATFRLKEPLAETGDGTLQFVMTFPYQDGRHMLGRFRLSVTTDEQPLRPGLPAAVAEAVAAGDAATDEQMSALAAYLDETADAAVDARRVLADAARPRPVDPQLASLRRQLRLAEKPLPPDPRLVRLNRAVDLSAEQLKTPRLTAAQDVTWALINSPAFLFNH